MFNPITILKKEHQHIKTILSNLEYAIKDGLSKIHFISQINKIDSIWNTHEKREEEFFDWFKKKGNKFPTEKFLLDEHRELRGHWNVLKKAANLRSNIDFRTALDTDGKILIDKFRKHIEIEDKFLSNLKII